MNATPRERCTGTLLQYNTMCAAACNHENIVEQDATDRSITAMLVSPSPVRLLRTACPHETQRPADILHWFLYNEPYVRAVSFNQVKLRVVSCNL